MIEKKILMVVSYDPQTLPNQPFYNVVNYFAGKFREVDYATCTNLYAGPPVPLPQKVSKSFHNLLFERTRVSQEGNIKHLITRRLKLPHTAQTMLSDFWLIANAPDWLKESHYDICFYSCPQNAFFPAWLKQSGSASKVVYYDIDFFPDHVDARSPLCSKVLAWRENYAVRHADGVISVSKPLTELRKRQGAKKALTVPNGVVLERFIGAREKEPHPPTQKKLGVI
jgi:hypothetical protein